MPSYSALSFILVALAAIVHTLPVDEIPARNGIGSASSGGGGQASGGSVTAASNSCTGATSNCIMSDLLDMSVVKLGSENGGKGGSALSGASRGNSVFAALGRNNTRVPVGSGFSGAGGQAPGGSIVDNHPGLIELGSDDAGEGGAASSGDSTGLVIDYPTSE